MCVVCGKLGADRSSKRPIDRNGVVAADVRHTVMIRVNVRDPVHTH